LYVFEVLQSHLFGYLFHDEEINLFDSPKVKTFFFLKYFMVERLKRKKRRKKKERKGKET